ncbi:WXG100 family type VII secretion target [Streptomyces catenulae]|uniref:ESAT-6-like protein n=1 Tax=Streptomyces catenulae TaxID=66875 RepID=A0ABV2YSF2_9ACTN|nr:WXG100 family type VII secretion target [Streptomyces catenulae]
MTTDYQVTPEMVADAAVSCDNTAAEVESKLQMLKAYVVQLEDMWQGVAHQTFVGYMQQYDINAQHLHHALTEIATGLRTNHVNYSQSEEDNIRRHKALEHQLPPARI